MPRSHFLRVPIQARARLRRESLLDATARILERGGYDELTTNGVALEADAAIGTVYQYFPSREALLSALLARHGERLGAAIDDAITHGDPDPLATADRVVDAFAHVWRAEPGYRAAWSAMQAQSLLARVGAAWGVEFTERIAALLRTIAPTLTKADARLIAKTAVHLVSGLLLAAMAESPRASASLVNETKVALRAYLVTRLAGVLGG